MHPLKRNSALRHPGRTASAACRKPVPTCRWILPVLGSLLLSASLLAMPSPTSLNAQDRSEQEGNWNAPDALRLAERGRAARQELVLEGDLESYRALTEGHIYFFVDPEEGERSLIRVDQIAVELFWEAPEQVRQRLIGERSETRLPVRDFSYYLDRLTLVQYGFGDEIRVGQGMDVSGVPHPFASMPDPEAPPHYDYRLADSISLHLPGEPEPLRIYELQVRPRDPGAPGMLGSIFLERDRASLVRMEFTFTPASYVDPRTDRIAIELDYGRWEGKYWLPNLQRIEVRREIPELDLGVGTVIRAVLRVGNYELNAPIPDEVRYAPPVTALADSTLQDYEFPGGLFSSLERDGLADIATRADPRELRVEAARLLRNRPPSGLSPIRLHLPDVSSFVSYDRTRGLDLGAGLSIRPRGTLRARIAGGWSFGPNRPRAAIHLDGIPTEQGAVELGAEWNGRRDLGLTSGAAPILSTLSAALLGEDHRSPFRASGATIAFRWPIDGGGDLRVEFGAERHRSESLQRASAPWRSGQAFRPVLPVDDGTFGRVGARWSLPIDRFGSARGGQITLDADMLLGGTHVGGRVGFASRGTWRTESGDRDLEMAVRAGTLVGDPLAQLHRLIGGRGSVPGHPHHAYVGRSLITTSLQVARDLGSPLFRIRGGLHGGWTDGRTPARWDALDPAPEPFPGATAGVIGGATAGVGVLYDLIRIEGARGFGGRGEWQLLLSLDPRWWEFL